MLRNLKISLRLILSYLLLSVLVMVVGYIGYNGFRHISADVEQVTKSSLVEFEGAVEMKTSLYKSLVAVEELLLEKYRVIVEPDEEEEAKLASTLAKEEINQSLADFEEIILLVKQTSEAAAQTSQEKGEHKKATEEAAEAGELSEIEEEFETYKDNVNRFIKLTKTDLEGADEFLKDEIEVHFRHELMPLVVEYAEEESDEIKEEEEHIDVFSKKESEKIIFLGFGSFVFSLLLGLIVTQSISLPIKELIAATRSVSVGNLKAKIKIKGRDEIRELGDDFNMMVDQLVKKTDAIKNERNTFISSIKDLPIGFILVDLEANVIFRNQAARKILGLPDDTWLLESIDHQFKIKQKIHDIIQKVINIKVPLQIKEAKLENKKYVKTLIVPIVDKQQQQATNVVIILEDITDDKLLSKKVKSKIK